MKIFAAILVGVFMAGSAFAENAADCKTARECVEQGDRAAAYRAEWASVAYAKAAALALIEANEMREAGK